MIPGEIILADSNILLNEGRTVVTIIVQNTGDQLIKIGSHTHFFTVNQDLHFDRTKTRNFRLNIPSGTTIQFEPGDSRIVTLVRYTST